MARQTKFTVYVDKEIMTDPHELIDAVLAHMIKKELDIRERKRFLAGFIRCVEGLDTEPCKERLAYIDEWVIVRDIETFPFRFNKKTAKSEEIITDPDEIERIALDDSTNKMTSHEDVEEDGLADKEVEGGVSVDDGADGEPESGASSE